MVVQPVYVIVNNMLLSNQMLLKCSKSCHLHPGKHVCDLQDGDAVGIQWVDAEVVRDTNLLAWFTQALL